MGVIAVSVVRDEVDVIATTVRQLVGEGVEQVIVADNRSTDGTAALLEQLVTDGLPLSVLPDDDPGHRQGDKITALAHEAARRGADWVLPFDADELWYSPLPGRTIADAVLDLPADVDVVLAEGWDHVARTSGGLSPWRRPEPRPEHLPKVVFRAGLGRRVAEGSHAVTPAGHAVRGPLAYRHLQYRSPEQMARKVRQGAAALVAAGMPADVGVHWRELDALPDEGIAAEWERLCAEEGLVYDPAPLHDLALPSVTLIVPTRNHGTLLPDCIASLVATTDAPIVVVDDAAERSVAETLRPWLEDPACDLTLVRNEVRQKFAGACNRGAEAATTDRLVILNDDVIALPGWLTALNRHPGVAGANLLYADGSPQHTGVFFRRRRRRGLEAYNRTWPAPTALVPAVTGACLLIDTSLYAELGGFDERYMTGYEDVDLCLRAREAGVDVAYAADARLIHLESQTPGRFDDAMHNVALLQERWSGPGGFLKGVDVAGLDDPTRPVHRAFGRAFSRSPYQRGLGDVIRRIPRP
jgi:GT2 family glycosyltransferase